jgi:hypothetical protein
VGLGTEVITIRVCSPGGIVGAGRVRSIFDLDSWILGSGLSTGVQLWGYTGPSYGDCYLEGGGGGGCTQ